MVKTSSKLGRNFSTGRWFIFSLLLLRFVFSQTLIYAGTWSQTTQADFELNSQSGTDIYASGGDVKIGIGAYSTDNNTVLLMHFGEGSWNATTIEVGDSSGKGNHGKAYGNATTTASGRFGRAGSFDGTGDYVDCGTDASLFSGTGDITLEAWFKTTNTDSEGRGILTIGAPSVKDCLSLARAADGYFVFGVYTIGSTLVPHFPANLANDGNWHHLAGTKSGDILKLYLDGVLKDTKTGSCQ